MIDQLSAIHEREISCVSHDTELPRPAERRDWDGKGDSRPIAMHILGISAFYHDSAAALITDGRIVAAAQEERFTRRKHDAGFPRNAISYCLAEAKLAAEHLDAVVFYEKPFIKFERLIETYLSFAPRGFASFRMAMPLWLKEKLFQKSLIGKQ